jgi:glucan phosphoethanolaminetransferase (alkaline phosphatase superfamily)
MRTLALLLVSLLVVTVAQASDSGSTYPQPVPPAGYEPLEVGPHVATALLVWGFTCLACLVAIGRNYFNPLRQVNDYEIALNTSANQAAELITIFLFLWYGVAVLTMLAVILGLLWATNRQVLPPAVWTPPALALIVVIGEVWAGRKIRKLHRKFRNTRDDILKTFR